MGENRGSTLLVFPHRNVSLISWFIRTVRDQYMCTHHLVASSRSICYTKMNRIQKEERLVKMFSEYARCVIVGGSCGFALPNIVKLILTHKKPCKDIHIVTSTAFQDKYILLRRMLENYNRRLYSNHHSRRREVNFHMLSSESLPQPEKIRKNGIVLFIECHMDNQKEIANYFIRGHYLNLTCYLFVRSYSEICRTSGILGNFNYFILYKEATANLLEIYTEHVTNLSFEQFKKLCNKCWSKKPCSGFLTIDLENPINPLYSYKLILRQSFVKIYSL